MNDDPIIQNLKKGIASEESGGNYKALGNPTASGDRAYGKYQVMASNIPSWTKEVTGTSYTPDDFLNNPTIQEQVASHKLGQYYQKYGNPSDVASAWFTGGPLKGSEQKQDINGTTTPQYVNNVVKGMGQNSQQNTQNTTPTKSNTDKIKENIDALEKQGAPREVIQSYLDSLNKSSGRKSFKDSIAQGSPQLPGNGQTNDKTLLPGYVPQNTNQPDKRNWLDKAEDYIASPLAGLAAKPVQILAKALGKPDPYAGGIGGISVSPLSLKGVITDSLGAASQVGGAALTGGLLSSLGVGASSMAPEVASNIRNVVDAGGDIGRMSTKAALDEFSSLSKAEKLNVLGDALKNAGAGDKEAIQTYMQELGGGKNPGLISKLGTTGVDYIKKYLLVKTLGSGLGGFLDSTTKK